VVQCSCSSRTISSSSSTYTGSVSSSGVAFLRQPYSSLPACSLQHAACSLSAAPPTPPFSLLAVSILYQPSTPLAAASKSLGGTWQ
jgi:hypothetical protein